MKNTEENKKQTGKIQKKSKLNSDKIWWLRKRNPEGKLHHYQRIPHFKILLDNNFH
jgi:hypothetical protein